MLASGESCVSSVPGSTQISRNLRQRGRAYKKYQEKKKRNGKQERAVFVVKSTVLNFKRTMYFRGRGRCNEGRETEKRNQVIQAERKRRFLVDVEGSFSGHERRKRREEGGCASGVKKA